jgi:hypothetical protein
VPHFAGRKQAIPARFGGAVVRRNGSAGAVLVGKRCYMRGLDRDVRAAAGWESKSLNFTWFSKKKKNRNWWIPHLPAAKKMQSSQLTSQNFSAASHFSRKTANLAAWNCDFPPTGGDFERKNSGFCSFLSALGVMLCEYFFYVFCKLSHVSFSSSGLPWKRIINNDTFVLINVRMTDLAALFRPFRFGKQNQTLDEHERRLFERRFWWLKLVSCEERYMNICRFCLEKLWKLNPQTEISGFFFGIQTQKPGEGAVK